jgi:hypothetical protein
MLKSARPDTVRAFLVLLHLLEAEIESVGQLLLADTQHQPSHAHSAANVHVNGFWSPDGRHWLSPSTIELLCRNALTFDDEAPETILAFELNETERCIAAVSAGRKAPPAFTRMAAGARCNFQLPVRWALRSAMKGKPSLRADYTVRGWGENRLECFHRRLSMGSKDSVYRSGIKSRISKRF